MKRQYTATVYIVEDDKVLLIKHRKLGMWLPPGGHVDEGEIPPETAVREALEETGLEVELLPFEELWIDRWNASSVIRPFLCLSEQIPAHGTEPAHIHYDQIYVGRVAGGELIQNTRETDDIQWFEINEIEQLVGDKDIFEETKESIRVILKKVSEHSSLAV